MFLRKTVAISGLMLALAACSQEQSPKTSDLTSVDESKSEEPQRSVGIDISRHTIVTMTFTKWGDVIMVDAGIGKTEAGKCKFVEPILSDDSTQWSPFQIYWLIFDRASDVNNGTQLSGIFAQDDSLASTELVRFDGARPHGFSYLSSRAAGYVKLSPVEAVDDGSTITTILDISGHKAAIRAIAEEKDGECRSRTEACVGGAECFKGGSFSPLGNIHVVQSMLGMPKEVKQEPANGVTPGK